jgi:hypothetical protein
MAKRAKSFSQCAHAAALSNNVAAFNILNAEICVIALVLGPGTRK